ncbi:MAG: 50S ribosome-binding GTPase, partial [Chitinivibrionia bacterium]|nr:50S ribosome-binding GTPase [Chitinivibrionia bacterium]
MPTNVTPEYKKAKIAYQQAKEPAERLACLKEMLRTIPKHKGTEHLQADIKTRIKELSEDLETPRKGSARKGPVYAVRPEGAAQAVLIGPPNAGKSSLHARLTGSHAEAGPYPHTTQAPLPGMLVHQDIHIQLVDLPPISDTYMDPWMPNALQPAQAAV